MSTEEEQKALGEFQEQMERVFGKGWRKKAARRRGVLISVSEGPNRHARRAAAVAKRRGK